MLLNFSTIRVALTTTIVLGCHPAAQAIDGPPTESAGPADPRIQQIQAQQEKVLSEIAVLDSQRKSFEASLKQLHHEAEMLQIKMAELASRRQALKADMERVVAERAVQSTATAAFFQQPAPQIPASGGLPSANIGHEVVVTAFETTHRRPTEVVQFAQAISKQSLAGLAPPLRMPPRFAELGGNALLIYGTKESIFLWKRILAAFDKSDTEALNRWLGLGAVQIPKPHFERTVQILRAFGIHVWHADSKASYVLVSSGGRDAENSRRISELAEKYGNEVPKLDSRPRPKTEAAPGARSAGEDPAVRLVGELRRLSAAEREKYMQERVPQFLKDRVRRLLENEN